MRFRLIRVNRRKAIGALLLVGAAAMPAAVAACSSDAEPVGAIMLAVSTNMRAPKDVDALGLRITSNGVPIFDDTRQVAPNGEVKFPATLAVLASKDPRATVKIRVVAFRGSEARILRDVVTTVPQARVALLRLPIQWLDDGSGVGDVRIPLGDLRSTCTIPDETSIGGRCRAGVIDSESLPTYDERDVFGGGSAALGDGACFDARACFEGAALLTVDRASCSVQLPDGAPRDRVNLAIVLPPGSDGECTALGCLVPLDAHSPDGWSDPGADGGAEGSAELRLPEAVCARLDEGKALGVAATFGCTSKRDETPLCGEASAVSGSAITPTDGGFAWGGGVCGDGRLGNGEACDDGNLASGDGCSSACAIENGFVCPEPGKPCVVGPEDFATGITNVTAVASAGDTIYAVGDRFASAWRKSTKERLSLVGVFDDDGSGVGDHLLVARGDGAFTVVDDVTKYVHRWTPPSDVILIGQYFSNARGASFAAMHSYIHTDDVTHRVDDEGAAISIGGAGERNFFLVTTVASTGALAAVAVEPDGKLYRCDDPTYPTMYCSALASNAGGPIATDGAQVYYMNGAGTGIYAVPLSSTAFPLPEPTLLAGGETLPTTPATAPRGPIAVDANAVSWIDRQNRVRRVALGGGPVTTLANETTPPRSLVSDGQHVYWALPSRGVVRRRAVTP